MEHVPFPFFACSSWWSLELHCGTSVGSLHTIEANKQYIEREIGSCNSIMLQRGLKRHCESLWTLQSVVLTYGVAAPLAFPLDVVNDVWFSCFWISWELKLTYSNYQGARRKRSWQDYTSNEDTLKTHTTTTLVILYSRLVAWVATGIFPIGVYWGGRTCNGGI